MQKLQNDTLQKFFDNFVEELKRENEDMRHCSGKELDIPFIISSLWHNFNNRENDYKEFISDLKDYSEYNVIIEESKNDYNGIIDVLISLVKYETFDDTEDFSLDNYECPDYDYKFEFSYDNRYWGVLSVYA